MKIEPSQFFGPAYRVKYNQKLVIPIIERGLDRFDRLGDVILALEDLLKSNPEEPSTGPIAESEGRQFRLIRTEPGFDAPGVTLLYYVDAEAYVVYVEGARIEEPDAA